jgi:hypothetical protein
MPCAHSTRTGRRAVRASRSAVLAAAVLWAGGLAAPERTLAQAYQPGQAHTRYLGNHPSDDKPSWADDMQGLAHDRWAWLVTQTDKLWHIPVYYDLAGGLAAGILVRSFGDDLPPYNHFGDPDYVEVDGQGYVLVPVERHADETPPVPDPYCARLAVFSDLPGLPLAKSACLGQQGRSAAWVAVDPDRVVYSSRFDIDPAADPSTGATGILRYEASWSVLDTEAELKLDPLAPLELRDRNGEPMALAHIQGGVFDPSGELLFLVSDRRGILVFRLAGDHLDLIDESCNPHTGPSCRFAYEFDNTTPLAPDGLAQEPEGIDFWDLNDGSAPGIRGELHVVLVDNQGTLTGQSDDSVFVKHYTAYQWVDSAATSAGEGKVEKPYRSLAPALSSSWPGSILRVRGAHAVPAGTTVGTPQLRVEAWDAPATVNE